MSLFSSAFDNGPGFGAGPSSIPLESLSRPSPAGHERPGPSAARQKPNKGKRAAQSGPSPDAQRPHANGLRNALGMPEKKSKKGKKRRRGETTHEDKLGSTQRNMEQVMSRLEAGVSDDRGDSRPMGMSNQQKKRKFDNQEHPQVDQKPQASASKPGTALEPTANSKRRESAEVRPGDSSDRAGHKGKNKHTAGSSHAGPKNQHVAPSSIPEAQRPNVGDDIELNGLTKMQKGMRTKLEEARFRWINEQLYSNSSKEAVAMMRKDPKVFSDYHSTHRLLTSAWPAPPLPFILEKLRPLPLKTVIVDLGCGDVSLARTLVPEGKVVLSYDLVGDAGVDGTPSTSNENAGWVVEADFLDHVPLPGRPGMANNKDKIGQSSEVVDVVVCCLSLMGTNWVGGIYEACRILKEDGTFHIAEVTSRLVSVDGFIEIVESFGFDLVKQSSPSTHFTLFEFTKTSLVPVGPIKGAQGWEERVEHGTTIMKGCVYKKR